MRKPTVTERGKERDMTRIVFDLTKNVRIGRGSWAKQGPFLPPKRDDISHLIENIVDYCIDFGRYGSWHSNCIMRNESHQKEWVLTSRED